jgi:hypothetical protein
MTDESQYVSVTARIPAALHARIEVIRGDLSPRQGDPSEGPAWAGIVRAALEAWAQRQEATR